MSIYDCIYIHVYRYNEVLILMLTCKHWSACVSLNAHENKHKDSIYELRNSVMGD